MKRSDAPGVLFCADIFHTQGASIYAFRSYLSLLARAAKVLAPIPVTAMIPEGSIADGGHGFGFDLAAPFSADSLVRFAAAAGFVWQTSLQPSGSSCSYYDSDVRVGDALHLHRGLPVNRSITYGLERFRGDLSTMCSRFGPIFGRGRRPVLMAGVGLLRVSLLMMHWTSGALSHASVVLPERPRCYSVSRSNAQHSGSDATLPAGQA